MYVSQTEWNEGAKVFTLYYFCIIHLIPCCHPLKEKDECHWWDLTLGNYYQYSRYTMNIGVAGFIDLLHSLCIPKPSWDYINLMDHWDASLCLHLYREWRELGAVCAGFGDRQVNWVLCKASKMQQVFLSMTGLLSWLLFLHPNK